MAAFGLRDGRGPPRHGSGADEVERENFTVGKYIKYQPP